MNFQNFQNMPNGDDHSERPQGGVSVQVDGLHLLVSVRECQLEVLLCHVVGDDRLKAEDVQ